FGHPGLAHGHVIRYDAADGFRQPVTSEPLCQCKEAMARASVQALMDDNSTQHSASCHLLCKRNLPKQLAKRHRVGLQAQADYSASQFIVGYCALGALRRRNHDITYFVFSFLPESPINIVRFHHDFTAADLIQGSLKHTLRNRHSVFDSIAWMQHDPI